MHTNPNLFSVWFGSSLLSPLFYFLFFSLLLYFNLSHYLHLYWVFPLSSPIYTSFFSLHFFSSVSSLFLPFFCIIANSAHPHPSRSRGVLRAPRHTRLPERCMLGSVSERWRAGALWCRGPHHASPSDTAAERRCWLMWVQNHVPPNTQRQAQIYINWHINWYKFTQMCMYADTHRKK